MCSSKNASSFSGIGVRERGNYYTMSNTKHTWPVTPASSDTLLTLLETLPGALFVIDDDMRIVYANASAQTMLDSKREEIYSTSLWRGAPHLISTPLYQAVLKARQTRKRIDVEYCSPVTQIWLQAQILPTDVGLAVLFQEKAEPTRFQDAFFQSEQRYRDLLENISGGVAILTPDGFVLDISQRPLMDARLRREDVIGKLFIETPWWSYAPSVQLQLRAAIEQAGRGELMHFEARIRLQKAWYMDLAVTMTPHLDADRHVEYLICTGIDITARKRAEAETHALLDALPQLVWTGKPDGSIDSVSQSWCDYTGLTAQQAQEDGWVACIHPDEQQRVLEEWQHAVQAGGPHEIEGRVRQGTSGAYRWFLVQAMPVKDAWGTILKYVGTCTDIDDRKRAEQQLKASEENWHVLAEMIPQLVWVGQLGGPKEYFNQRWFDYTRATDEQMGGTGWFQFLHPDDQERARTLWLHALEMGTPYEIESRFRDGTSGTYRWFVSRAHPMRDETGHVVKWFGTLTDIEEQKQVEQRLKASEENWHALAETIPQLVWVTQADGLNEYKNQRWIDYTGKPGPSDIWDHLQFLHPDDREASQALWQHALDTGDMYEHEERLQNKQTGEYRWFLARGTPICDEAGHVVKWFGTLTDIEEQKQVEESLRQSQQRIRALINSNIIGITASDLEENIIVQANDAWLQMTGYTQEDVRDRTLSLEKTIPPDQMPILERASQEADASGQSTPFETELICQDGSRLPVLVGGVLLSYEHRRQIISFTLDNSARKELEQRKDAFISMASHELRNPLAALKLQNALLHRQLTKLGIPASAPALSRMETQINKVTRLVEELLDVSKIQVGRLEYLQETVDLDALLWEITDTMQQTHPSHRILVRGATHTSLIGDPDRLGQVFINLLGNAIKYSPEAETVEMDLSSSEDAVTIRVRDYGLGISREQRAKIFDRFYRVTGSKQKAIPGLGMGLYIVAEIVKHHEGTITVDSTLEQGSTFTVTLPKQLAWPPS